LATTGKGRRWTTTFVLRCNTTLITTWEPGERGRIQRGIDRINSLITPERILRRKHSRGAPLRRRIDRRTILALRQGERKPAPARVRQGHLRLLLGRAEADRIHHAVVVAQLSCEAVEVAAQILRQRRLVLGKPVSKHFESDTELGCVNELVDASGLIGADLAAKQDHEATKPPRQIRM
jgi:hypothetical protein